MDRDRATFEAFCGVELHLAGGVIQYVDGLSVSEAIHLIRLSKKAADGDGVAAFQFLRDFVERADLGDHTLAVLGLSYDEPEAALAEVTVMRAVELGELLAAAQMGSADSQYEFLSEYPKAAGFEPDSRSANDVFALGDVFVKGLYAAIDELSRNFLRCLTSAPEIRQEVPGATMARSGTPGSMI